MNNNNAETIIWNKGDKPEKSAKRTLSKLNELELSIPSINNSSTIYRESNNKRQDSSDKISERYLIGQRGLNPYTSNTSYVKDIEIQHSFLIPKCSNEHPKNRIEFTN